jgi:hypothetical protein
MALENGWIYSDLPIEEARRRFHIDPSVVAYDDPTGFSRSIRRHHGDG